MDKKELMQRTKAFVPINIGIKLEMSLPNTYLSNHIKGQLIRSAGSVRQRTDEPQVKSVLNCLSEEKMKNKETKDLP